jgi:hypothetical protein
MRDLRPGASSGGTREKAFLPTNSSGRKPRAVSTEGLTYRIVPSSSTIATMSREFSVRERKRLSLDLRASSACLRSVMSTKVTTVPTRTPSFRTG